MDKEVEYVVYSKDGNILHRGDKDKSAEYLAALTVGLSMDVDEFRKIYCIVKKGKKESRIDIGEQAHEDFPDRFGVELGDKITGKRIYIRLAGGLIIWETSSDHEASVFMSGVIQGMNLDAKEVSKITAQVEGGGKSYYYNVGRNALEQYKEQMGDDATIDEIVSTAREVQLDEQTLIEAHDEGEVGAFISGAVFGMANPERIKDVVLKTIQYKDGKVRATNENIGADAIKKMGDKKQVTVKRKPKKKS